MFIVSYYFIFKKIAVKYSFLKVSLSLSKAYTSVVLSAIKSFIKFTTSLLIYCKFFKFNFVIKNKKTISNYYKKKIIESLLKVVYSLTLNTYKTIIINLKLSL